MSRVTYRKATSHDAGECVWFYDDQKNAMRCGVLHAMKAGRYVIYDDEADREIVVDSCEVMEVKGGAE